MGKNLTLVLIAVALALAGLGHYYLLYRDVYFWDAVLFYVAASLLLLWAYLRSEPWARRDRARVRSALRRLEGALREALFRKPNQPLVGLLILVNFLAALIAFLSPAPVSFPLLLLAASLWASGVLALALLFPWLRRAGVTPEWLKLLQERLVERGAAVTRFLLIVGLGAALVGQFCFFYRREQPRHVRDAVLFWCIAILSFVFLLWMERLRGKSRNSPDTSQEGMAGQSRLENQRWASSPDRALSPRSGDRVFWEDLRRTERAARTQAREERLAGESPRRAGLDEASEEVVDMEARAANNVTRTKAGDTLPLWAPLASVPFAVLSQYVLISHPAFAWLGVIGYLLALLLFVGGLMQRFPRLSSRRLLVGVGVGLVALATYWAHARVWASSLQVVFGVLLPWVAGMVLAAIGLSGPRTWKLTAPGWRRDAVAMALLFAVALALRVVGLGRAPDVMSGDEAAMAMEAQRILNGNPSNPFRVALIGFMSHPVLFYYILSVGLRLFGWNLFGLRFMAAILGALGAPAVYLLARSTFGRKAAWIGALFMAGWSFPLHFSRLAQNVSADPLFGALVMWGLLSGLVYGRRRGFIVAGLALGLGLYFYYGTHLLMLLTPATLLISGFERLRRHWRGLLILAFCFLLSVGPLMTTFIVEPGQFRARFARRPVVSSEGGLSPGLLLKSLGRAAFAFIYTRDVGYFYRPNIPLLGLLSGALFVLGLGLAAWRWREPRYAVLLAWIGLTIVVGGWLFKDPPHYQRYQIAVPAVCLLVGRATVVALRRAARLWRWRPVVQRGLALFVALVLLAANAGYYFGVYTPAGGFHWDRNTVIADRTAHLMVDLGADYTTYFFGTTHMPLGAFRALVRFLAPGADWMDVLEAPSDWHFVKEGRGACFIVIPERAEVLPLLRAQFPDGEERQVNARDGQLLFTVYQVDEVKLQQEEGEIG